jgi:recombination protein RecA
MKPKKEELIELYVNQNITTYGLAEKYNVNRRTIGRWFSEYNIQINPKQRKFQKLKKVPLTKEQKEMLIGTILGDGGVYPHGRKNKSYRFLIGHCEKQKPLVENKKLCLNNLVNNIRQTINKKKNSIMWSFSTVVHHDFKFFRDLFYDNNKKVVREKLINYITPISLAYLIMDDGSSDGKYNIRIHTNGFTKNENEILRNIFYIKFGVSCKICEFQKNDKKYYYLSFNKKNSQILSDLIRPYIIKCMEYKILPSSTTLCQTPNKMGEDKV